MNENEERLAVHLDQLEKAIKTLKDAFEKKSPSQLERDGTIQRFEYTIELAWKTIQSYMRGKDLRGLSPKDVFDYAFKKGIMDNVNEWKALLAARNKTSHMYNRNIADEIYLTVKEKHTLIDQLIDSLKSLM